MAKGLAKRNLICFSILACLLIVLCFVSFGIPGTISRFTGFANAITTDIDISGGVASKYEITYDSEVLNTEAELNRTIAMINSKIASFGYGSGRISANENDEIYIEIPDIKQSKNILNAIATSGVLYITTQSDVASVNETTDLSGDEVTDVNAQFSQITSSSYSWGVTISLTDGGQDKLAELTSSGSGTIYIYVGDTTITSISYSSQIDQNYMYFYGTSSTEDTANVTALQILMGKYGAEFDMVNNQIVEIAPLISATIQTWIYVALALIAALFIVAMFSLFGEFGYILTMSLVFFIALTIFFMQAIPIYILSFSGILGAVLGGLIFFMSNMIIFGAIKKGYAEGKKIPLATKFGFNSNVMKIVDISVIAIIASIFIYILGGVYAQSFAFAVGICSALNLLLTLLMTRLFVKWYVAINSTKAEKLHFKRGDNVNELN